MALSYVVVSMLPLLLVAAAIAINYGGGDGPPASEFASMLDRTAGDLARTGERQERAGGLSSASPFPIGSPWSGSEDVVFRRGQVIVPYVADDGVLGAAATVYSQPLALVADRAGIVAGTSYPARYPPGRPLAELVPSLAAQAGAVLGGRGPRDGSATWADWGIVRWTMRPVTSGSAVIGIAYVQASPPVPLGFGGRMPSILAFVPLAGLAGLVGLLMLVPIGAGFGLVTMRGPIRRLRQLGVASSALAAGDYARRVAVRAPDELGQLELQFNTMADQLVAAMRTQAELSDQNARLAERGRMAAELHDSISQDLFSLRMTLHGLETNRAGDAELVGRLRDLRVMATRAIRQMRALLLELRPPVAPLDVAAALRELAATYSSRLGIEVTASADAVPLPGEVAQALVRIAHEALSNAARHARAERIEMGLRQLPDRVELWVADEGRGFDSESVEAARGLGLSLASERAARLGGDLRIDSEPGRGTRVTVSIPRPEG
jgi:signal transduction histidine kinase